MQVRSLTNFKSSARQRILAIEIQRAPLSGAERLVKRALDIIVASVALMFFLPVMALTAIAIKLDSSGPVIFRQLRKGFNGQPFVMFKFRTMTVQENGPVVAQATPDDPRVTAIGRLLRSASIDELPQLLNVLKGDMSLIGPRPHASAHDDYFQTILGDYAFRHHVKPGITGWAQCNGARGATPSIEHISERVKLDLWYINNWSLWLDILILIKTFFEVLRKRNAYWWLIGRSTFPLEADIGRKLTRCPIDCARRFGAVDILLKLYAFLSRMRHNPLRQPFSATIACDRTTLR
jgi:undecaprenyl-phosphate galactose phosphotransferase/putative colanic acid biosynthesis UDP-glucose lipid carrier transferase